MSENAPREHKVPTDLAQIPIVWRYELLKYLRSRRLIASIAVAFLVVGLIYALPIAFGHPYSGHATDTEVKIVGLGSLGVPPGTLPFESVGVLNDTGVHADTITVSINGTVVPRGTLWFVAGENGTPSVNVPGSEVVLLFVNNVSADLVTASYDWSQSAQNFESGFLSFASILIVICATFFGADAIVGEYQNRTGYLMFPNPIKRQSLFFGKFAASMTAGIVVMVIFYASVLVLSVVSVGAVDSDLALSFAFALEYMVAVMAIAYLISSVLKGTTGATVLTFFLFIMILPILDSISMVSGVKLGGSITFAGGVIQYIIQDPYPVDSSSSFGGGFTFYNFYPEPVMAAITMAGYAIVAIVLSIILFKRKQLSG
jgi:ABC-2 type transport system permease protein